MQLRTIVVSQVKKYVIRKLERILLDQDHWLESNVAALCIINILDKNAVEECIRDVLTEPNLVALTAYNVPDEIILVHHLTRIRKTLKKNAIQKNEKIVSLNGFGPLTLAARFKSSDHLLAEEFTSCVLVPSNKEI